MLTNYLSSCQQYGEPKRRPCLHLRCSAQFGLNIGTDGASKLRMLQDLKGIVNSKRRKVRLDADRIMSYPEEPSWQIIDRFYTPEDPPLGLLEAPSLPSAVLPLRTSHKSVAASSSHQLVPVAKTQPPAPAGPTTSPMDFMQNPNQMMQMMQMFQPLMQMAQLFQNMQAGGDGGSGQAASLANLQVFTPPTQGRRLSFHGNPGNEPAKSPPDDSQQEKDTGDKPVLALPDLPEALSPQEQAKLVANATKERQEAKAAEPKAEPKAKGKAKAKAKAKTAAKAAAKAKTAAKAASAPKKEKPQAKAKTKPEDRKVYDLDERPPRAELGDATTWYRSGKIHVNSGCYRVFLRATDRCDRKIRILDGQEDQCWEKALKLIDESLASGDSAPNVE